LNCSNKIEDTTMNPKIGILIIMVASTATNSLPISDETDVFQPTSDQKWILVPNPWYQRSILKDTFSEPKRNWLYEVIREMNFGGQIKRSQNGDCQSNNGQFPRRQRIRDLIHKR